MPIYEYKCRSCGQRLEVEQSIKDDALTAAPGCTDGADHDLKKVFHPVGIAFKGSGFYKNDARGGKKRSGSTSEGSGDSSGESTSSDTTSSSAGTESSGSDTKADSGTTKTETNSATTASKSSGD